LQLPILNRQIHFRFLFSSSIVVVRQFPTLRVGEHCQTEQNNSLMSLINSYVKLSSSVFATPYVGICEVSLTEF
jgi:hypothetical protein